MGIKINSNFDVQSAIPLDKRSVVADVTARNALASGVRYVGMEVLVQSDGVKYRLVGGITNSDWVAESSSVSVSDATTTAKGIVKLAGDLGGTADLPTVPALSGKEPSITAGTTAQYYRGDKTFQTLDKTAVGLSNVDNTSDASKPVSTATQTALDLKENSVTAGTTSQYYRGDKTWQTLNKAAVGLSNVNNTNDADKAISTATQTALDLKANIASPALTGTPTAPTQSPLDNSTKIATTEYVDDAIAASTSATLSLVEPTIEFGINYLQTLTSYTTTEDTYIQGPVTIGATSTVTIGATKTLNIM